MDTQKNKTAYVWLLALIVVGFFVYAMWRPSSDGSKSAGTVENQPTQYPTNQGTTPTMNAAPDDTGKTVATTQPASDTMTAAKEFTLKADNFTFDVKEIKVKRGDTVKITLDNTEGTHDWKLDEFKAATKVLQAGQKETITFVADKTGTFEYYCSVGQHRAMGMKGNFIVE